MTEDVWWLGGPDKKMMRYGNFQFELLLKKLCDNNNQKIEISPFEYRFDCMTWLNDRKWGQELKIRSKSEKIQHLWKLEVFVQIASRHWLKDLPSYKISNHRTLRRSKFLHNENFIQDSNFIKKMKITSMHFDWEIRNAIETKLLLSRWEIHLSNRIRLDL